jgi:glycosyltransferase involved in cell wall biosynthesis
MQLLGRKLAEKTALRKSNHIVVLSEYTKEKLKSTYGLPPAKIHVIPAGVDLNRFRPHDDKQSLRNRLGIPNGHFTLLTVRNLEPRMGLENLILGFKKILEAKTHVFLVVGGEGPLTQDLKSLARETGVEDSVKFVPTRELEGFGLVTVEALASGLPVLGTPVGGTKEILAHMGQEFLFSDATPDSMARLILKSMQDWAINPEIYNEVSRKCRKVAENHFSWDTHITRLENLFQFTVQ